MRVPKRTFLICFFGGLAAFAVAIAFHVPLITEGVPGGIGDHQSAPDAATVDAIQQSWRNDGLFEQAVLAMLSDLIFIGIYGVGCILGGLYFKGQSNDWLRRLGWVALVSGMVFLITDYGETIAQFIQLLQNSGDDDLAGLASSIRPTKMVSFVAAFVAIIAALIVERRVSRSA